MAKAKPKIKYEEFRKEPKKIRKKRKPMTEEQKAAASARLAKAREARAKKNPPKNTGIHPDVLAKPDDDPLSLVKVREWIKSNKEKLQGAKQEERSGAKGGIAKVASLEGYIRSMEQYIRSSVWNDMFYGEHRSMRIKQSCLAMAYNPDGTPKRTKGIFYPDLGVTWQGEDAYAEHMARLEEELV
tara:strand:+ start:1523 stop:2077 length:555 start_codon:yes stop_codon:yes gene_type:complete